MPTPLALQIIRHEHEALASVLRTMQLLVRDSRHHNREPDFRVLRTMLFYVDEFPERLHHVKETTMLFPRLREITHEANDVLDALDRDHGRGESLIRELQHKLTAWELLGETRRTAFEAAMTRYLEFYLRHMRTEETEVLPLAERVFGEDDWRVLDRAFLAQRDPLAGGRADAPYEQLFATILRITPAPFGLGDPIEKA